MINKKTFLILITLLGALFLMIFIALIIPPLIENPDIIGAFLAGFVNPYAAGYSSDVIITWCILAVWVMYEAKDVKHGWTCLLLGIVPGVAVGLAAYLVLRETQRSK